MLYPAALPALIAWGERQPLVRAMLLTSTRAVPQAHVDALSDYDIVLIVAELRPFTADRRWVEAFGTPLVSFWDRVLPDPEYGLEQAGNVIQYTDGLKIDFSLWPVELFRRIAQAPTLLDELDAGYQVLLDKDQLTADLAQPTYTAYIPKLPDNAAYVQWIEEFFSDVPYVAKCLWRDELFPAKWCLDHDMKHAYLRPMLEWYVTLESPQAPPVGSLGKGLKKRLPPELWAELEQCYAGADLEENWEALFRTVACFRRVATLVGERLGFSYPEDLDRRVTAYARQIRQMEPGEAHA